ncbi:metallophosphoesterase family protein [Gorillibacterium sp. sgz5001074]|uniref:metallophosphoesterase family protein n=1 Tax=Gorillibacterium sp. sgz5001074 TaxID=3446695 RepID=UPI003F6735EB
MGHLYFRQDGTFTIAQFTDIHWKNGEEPDRRSHALMKRILETELPDLVLFTGDVIHGEACRDPLESYQSAVQAVEEMGIPWAAVFGNHDAEHPRGTKERLIRLQEQLPCCITEAGPKLDNRLGNYTLRIHAREQERPSAVLYLLDSGGSLERSPGGYEWITHSQIGWYKEESARLMKENHGEPVLGLAFFHIPLPEYHELWNYYTCYGHNFEGMGCPKVNSGLFAAFLDMGDVCGVFTGHDHINDFWGELHGIRLHYGRATGYGSYGKEDFHRGARLIRLTEGRRSFSTWLRLEDGTRVERQQEHPPEHVWRRI